jgi:hypothetical protein
MAAAVMAVRGGGKAEAAPALPVLPQPLSKDFFRKRQQALPDATRREPIDALLMTP